MGWFMHALRGMITVSLRRSLVRSRLLSGIMHRSGQGRPSYLLSTYSNFNIKSTNRKGSIQIVKTKDRATTTLLNLHGYLAD